MNTRVSVLALAGAVLLGIVGTAQQPAPSAPTKGPSGIGRAPTRAEVQAWDIAIHPDGTELPPGSGNATQGTLVFTQRGCAECHGPTGKEGPARVLVGGTIPMPFTGIIPIVYFPYAPMIWDFINRAMPFDRPNRLSADEVYAVTAYLLFRNGVIQEDDVMDAKSLPKVQMPHRAAYKVPPVWKPGTPRGFKILPPP